ncbi:hypothetical protein NHX12_017538, partial [Muraenolepis orangiensis]
LLTVGVDRSVHIARYERKDTLRCCDGPVSAGKPPCFAKAHEQSEKPSLQEEDINTLLKAEDHQKDQGMLLPHSILGNLQDFKRYLETRGEIDLVGTVPQTTTEDLASSSSPAGGQADRVAGERGCGLSASQAHTQSHALQHWSTHMRLRRQQQDSLAKSLHRPKDWLLMSRANCFRKLQEQRELLSLVLPAIQPGHGYHVGSEFWSLPEGLGDEVSGIAATLTLTQRGQRGSLDIDGLEVIGCSSSDKHFSVLPNREKTTPEERGPTGPAAHPPIRYSTSSSIRYSTSSIRYSTSSIRYSTSSIRYSTSSIRYSTSSHQGQLRISSRIGFEVVIGETARSQLLLCNPGNTAVYYTWQRETQMVEFLFKSDTPGITCELWQLNTQPVLLGGAAMQVTLRGVALDQDTNADHRLVLERELEKKAVVKVCQSLVYKVLQGITTLERPAELYLTQDEFLRKNPKLLYGLGPVEVLRSLWQSAAPGVGWDLSVQTLRQAVLSLPEEDPGPLGTRRTLTRAQGLAQLNSTLLELPQDPHTSAPITSATIG